MNSKKHFPKKKLGQNFLCDEGIIHSIVRAINPKPQECLIEIGPGLGALTKQLAVYSDVTLHAIELDNDLIPVLKQAFQHHTNFSLHHCDVLKFNFEALLQALPNKTPVKIVGNLPYNISTPLLCKLFALLTQYSTITGLFFMLQKEVANRLTAPTGSRAYGRLSIIGQYYCTISEIIEVPPTAFDPTPKVNSAVVYFNPKTPISPAVKDIAIFQMVTAQAFQQRRKKLSNALRSLISPSELQQLQIDDTLRAEMLPVDAFVHISNYLFDKS